MKQKIPKGERGKKKENQEQIIRRGYGVGNGMARGGSGGVSARLPRRQLLGGARRRPSRKRLAPARGHSLTPRRWQKEKNRSFLVFCFFFE